MYMIIKRVIIILSQHDQALHGEDVQVSIHEIVTVFLMTKLVSIWDNL